MTNAKLFVFTLSAVLAGHRRRALRAAGRHHQPERVLAGQLDRDRDLGLGRRARHAVGRDRRRGAGQPGEDLADRRRCPRSGCSSSARCSSLTTLVFPRGDRRAAAAAARRWTPAARGAAAGGRRPAAGQGAGMSVAAAPAQATAADVLLYLNGVTVSFDGFKALNDLSLVVEDGELRTIIGPNGAGKTTMMDVVTGKTRPDSGEVFFRGTDGSDPARRGGDRQSRHRPQVSAADRVREPDRVRKPRTGAGRQPQHLAHPVRPPDAGQPRAHRRDPAAHRPDRAERRACRRA